MKNLKRFQIFINEWLDSPGSVDVPGQATEIRVNSRNYTPGAPQMPEVVDSMYEAAFFNEFLDEQGKSEEFGGFLKKKQRTSKDITEYLKESFSQKTSK
jgi:hypothetical protein